MAINVSGQLFTWGSNSSGQLGHDSNEISSAPRLVRSLAAKQVVQIASGHYHSLALTNGMLKCKMCYPLKRENLKLNSQNVQMVNYIRGD